MTAAPTRTITLGRALGEAWRRVTSRRGLLAAMAIAQLLLAWIALRPTVASLSPLLDDRPGAAQLLRGDDGLLGELLGDHRELVVGGAAGAQVALALSGILAWLFAGALVVLYVGRDDEREAAGAAGAVAAMARAAPRTIAIGLVGLLLRLVPAIVGITLGWALFKDPPGGFGGALAAGIILVVGVGLLWALVTVAVDGARALALARPVEPSAPPLRLGRALKGGLALLVRRPAAAFALALLSTLATLALGALDLGLGHLTEGAELLHLAAMLTVELVRAAVAATLIVATGLVAVAPRKTAPPSP